MLSVHLLTVFWGKKSFTAKNVDVDSLPKNWQSVKFNQQFELLPAAIFLYFFFVVYFFSPLHCLRICFSPEENLCEMMDFSTPPPFDGLVVSVVQFYRVW